VFILAPPVFRSAAGRLFGSLRLPAVWSASNLITHHGLGESHSLGPLNQGYLPVVNHNLHYAETKALHLVLNQPEPVRQSARFSGRFRVQDAPRIRSKMIMSIMFVMIYNVMS